MQKTVEYSINGVKMSEDQAREIVMNTEKGKYVEVFTYVEVECHDGITRGSESSRIYEGQK